MRSRIEIAVEEDFEIAGSRHGCVERILKVSVIGIEVYISVHEGVGNSADSVKIFPAELIGVVKWIA